MGTNFLRTISTGKPLIIRLNLDEIKLDLTI